MENQNNKSTLDEFSEIQTFTLQQCKNEITNILSKYNERVLLWIVEYFYHSFAMKKLIPYHINPVNILITRNIKKEIPPSSYAKIVMMLSYQSKKEKNVHQEIVLHLFYTAYELLKSGEY
jgi:hypothetical protein